MTDETNEKSQGAGEGTPSSTTPPSSATGSILRDNFIARFVHGFWYPFRGLTFVLRNLSLLKFCVLPFLINIAIFSLVIGLAGYFWTDFVSGWKPENPAWYMTVIYAVLRFLAYVIIPLIFLVICGITFAIAGTVVAAPFLDFLSQRVEETALGVSREVPFSMKLMLTDLRIVLTGTFIRVGLGAGVLILLLPLFLIPGGQVVYFVVTTAFAIWFMALEFVDYSLSRARIGFWKKTHFAWRFRSTMLGFGSAVYLTLIIPIIGFICLPISTVGGTLLFLDMTKRFPELLELPVSPEAKSGDGPGPGSSPEPKAAG